MKNHHTRRLRIARNKARDKWKKGLMSSMEGKEIRGSPTPIKEEIEAFYAGFNMGYKTGRIHERTPAPAQKQVKVIQ